MLIPTLETKIRAIVKEEVIQLEKVMDARFSAVDVQFDGTNAGINARFDAVNARIEAVNTKVDSLEKRFPAVQEIAEIKARLNAIERERR